METSILKTIKKLVGTSNEDDNFDIDIITHINSAISIVTDLGIGPEEGFSITSESETWQSFLGTDKRLEKVKTFIYAKVKLIFDPPTSPAVIDSLTRIINEFEWRISVNADQKEAT